MSNSSADVDDKSPEVDSIDPANGANRDNNERNAGGVTAEEQFSQGEKGTDTVERRVSADNPSKFGPHSRIAPSVHPAWVLNIMGR